jgi:enoyl-CoA hydratase
MPDVLVSREGRAGRITLNRPAALHALTTDMCLAMDEALKAWAGDPDIELVVIDHAAGTRGFCAGGDIRMLAESGAGDGAAAAAFFRAEYRLNARMHNYAKPLIAFLDGVTMGGGVGISVHGSHRIATERTTFAMPETGIGLFPDVGGGWFLPRLPHGLAFGLWLALSGERLKGADVASAGIATHYMESVVVEVMKADIIENGLDLLSAMEWDETGSFEQNLDVIQRCFGRRTVEDIFAALAEEPDDWAEAQLNLLKTKSRQTLKVAHRQLVLGQDMETFEDNMRMEFRIGCRAVRRHDFQEGVRAVIIDKDNAPKWDPPTLQDVSEELLDGIFAPLGPGEPAELSFD